MRNPKIKNRINNTRKLENLNRLNARICFQRVINLLAESVRDLQKLGHKLGVAAIGAFGGYQAVMWDKTNRVWIGASESRKDGMAAGW